MILIRKIKKNPIQIGVILLILVMAVLNFVMIAELPFFVSSLQINDEIKSPRHILPFGDKAFDKVDGSAKDQMDRTAVVDDPVNIIYRSRHYNQVLRK